MTFEFAGDVLPIVAVGRRFALAGDIGPRLGVFSVHLDPFLAAGVGVAALDPSHLVSNAPSYIRILDRHPRLQNRVWNRRDFVWVRIDPEYNSCPNLDRDIWFVCNGPQIRLATGKSIYERSADAPFISTRGQLNGRPHFSTTNADGILGTVLRIAFHWLYRHETSVLKENNRCIYASIAHFQHR